MQISTPAYDRRTAYILHALAPTARLGLVPDYRNGTSYWEHPEGVTPYFTPSTPKDTPADCAATDTSDARALELPTRDTFTHKLAFVLSSLLIVLTIYHLGSLVIDHAAAVYYAVSNRTP